MEDTVKLKWYFRLFSKLDNEACNVDMTNRAVAWGIDWIAGSLITAFPTVIFYMALTKTQEVNQNLLAFDQPYGWVAGILSLLFCIAYYVIYPYRHNGQTCGKKFMDMKTGIFHKKRRNIHPCNSYTCRTKWIQCRCYGERI